MNLFVETDFFKNKLSLIKQYTSAGVPVLLVGPTGTGKTASVENLFQNENLIKFNFSSETTIEQLLGYPHISENQEVVFKPGPYTDAFKNGKPLLLDEFNLAHEDVLQCIEASLDTKILYLDQSDEEIKMNPNFKLIATQNEITDEFSSKRNILSTKLLSKFITIKFEDLSKDAYLSIANSMIANTSISPEIIDKLIDFHMQISNNNKVIYYTIRNMKNTILALINGVPLFNAILLNYGSEDNELLFEYMVDLGITGDESKLPLPELHLENYYENQAMRDVLSKANFYGTHKQPILIIGEEGCGKTQAAKWASEIITNKQPYTLICYPEMSISDLIGRYIIDSSTADQKITTKLPIQWVDGPITKAVREGHCIVLDQIELAQPQTIERLNPLFDAYSKKCYGSSDAIFKVHECSENNLIKIHDDFILIATITKDQLKQLSPALLNRFSIIYMNDQLTDLNDDFFKRYNLKDEVKNKIKELKDKKMSDIVKISNGIHILSQKYGPNFQETIFEVLSNIYSGKPANLPTPLASLILNGIHNTSDFFFEGVPELQNIIALIKILIETGQPLILESPTGLGKTSCAMMLGEQLEMQPLKVSFNSETNITQLFGNLTIMNGKSIKSNGPLDTAISEGRLFVADELNLAESSIIESLIVALEQKAGEEAILPNGEDPISVKPGFFFIGCQNGTSMFGRRELPPIIKRKVVILEYPFPKDSISKVIKKISEFYHKAQYTNSSVRLLENLSKNRKWNWSIREIRRFFKRCQYMSDKIKDFHTLDNQEIDGKYVAAEMLYSELSDGDKSIDDISSIISQSFQCSKDEIQKFLKDKLTVSFPDDNTIVMKKHNLVFTVKKTTNENVSEKLTTFWTALFWTCFNPPEDPLLIVGPTSFKTYLTNFVLEKADSNIIRLTRDSTTSSLVGSVVMCDKSAVIAFYRDILAKMCPPGSLLRDRIYNFFSKPNEIKKNDLDRNINMIMRNNKDFEPLLNNIKNNIIKIIDSDNQDDSFIKDYTTIFKPGIITMNYIIQKAVILKNFDKPPISVIERFNELFSNDPEITLNEDYPNTLTESNNKVIKCKNTKFRVIATCSEKGYLRLSEAMRSRVSVVRVSTYTSDDEKVIFKNYFEKIPDTLSFQEKNVIYNTARSLLAKNNSETMEEAINLAYKIIMPKMEDIKADGAPPFSFNNGMVTSKFTGIELQTRLKSLPTTRLDFTPSFSVMADVIFSALCLNQPLIIIGPTGNGKSEALNYVTQMINIKPEKIFPVQLSRMTSLEDLFGKNTLSVNPDGTDKAVFDFKPSKLLEKISRQYHSVDDPYLIIIEEMNLASSAVLDALAGLFNPSNLSIFLPNGEVQSKCNYFIIGMASENFQTNMFTQTIIHKKPEYLPEEFKGIVTKIFENDNTENKQIIIDDFCELHRGTTVSARHCQNYLLLEDIFKNNADLVDIPARIIFDQHLVDQRLDDKLIVKFLGSSLFVSGMVLPVKDKIEAMKVGFLTETEKMLFALLTANVNNRMPIIIQGPTASGKTFTVQLFAKIIGKKMKVLQLNNDMSASTIFSSCKPSSSMKHDQILVITELLRKFNGFFNEIIGEISNMDPVSYQFMEKQIESIKKKLSENTEMAELAKKLKLVEHLENSLNFLSSITLIDSDVVKAMKEGSWVLLDGAEAAPPDLLERIVTLLSPNPSINIYEDGKYYGVNDISENFRIIITYNPYGNHRQSKISPSILSRCIALTMKPIDETVFTSALIALSQLRGPQKLKNKSTEYLASLIGKLHMDQKENSSNNENTLTGRTIQHVCKAIINIFKDEVKDDDLKSIFEQNYSISDIHLNELITDGPNESTISELVNAQKDTQTAANIFEIIINNINRNQDYVGLLDILQVLPFTDYEKQIENIDQVLSSRLFSNHLGDSTTSKSNFSLTVIFSTYLNNIMETIMNEVNSRPSDQNILGASLSDINEKEDVLYKISFAINFASDTLQKYKDAEVYDLLREDFDKTENLDIPESVKKDLSTMVKLLASLNISKKYFESCLLPDYYKLFTEYQKAVEACDKDLIACIDVLNDLMVTKGFSSFDSIVISELDNNTIDQIIKLPAEKFCDTISNFINRCKNKILKEKNEQRETINLPLLIRSMKKTDKNHDKFSIINKIFQDNGIEASPQMIRDMQDQLSVDEPEIEYNFFDHGITLEIPNGNSYSEMEENLEWFNTLAKYNQRLKYCSYLKSEDKFYVGLIGLQDLLDKVMRPWLSVEGNKFKLNFEPESLAVKEYSDEQKIGRRKIIAAFNKLHSKDFNVSPKWIEVIQEWNKKFQLTQTIQIPGASQNTKQKNLVLDDATSFINDRKFSYFDKYPYQAMFLALHKEAAHHLKMCLKTEELTYGLILLRLFSTQSIIRLYTKDKLVSEEFKQFIGTLILNITSNRIPFSIIASTLLEQPPIFLQNRYKGSIFHDSIIKIIVNIGREKPNQVKTFLHEFLSKAFTKNGGQPNSDWLAFLNTDFFINPLKEAIDEINDNSKQQREITNNKINELKSKLDKQKDNIANYLGFLSDAAETDKKEAIKKENRSDEINENSFNVTFDNKLCIDLVKDIQQSLGERDLHDRFKKYSDIHFADTSIPTEPTKSKEIFSKIIDAMLGIDTYNNDIAQQYSLLDQLKEIQLSDSEKSFSPAPKELSLNRFKDIEFNIKDQSTIGYPVIFCNKEQPTVNFKDLNCTVSNIVRGIHTTPIRIMIQCIGDTTSLDITISPEFDEQNQVPSIFTEIENSAIFFVIPIIDLKGNAQFKGTITINDLEPINYCFNVMLIEPTIFVEVKGKDFMEVNREISLPKYCYGGEIITVHAESPNIDGIVPYITFENIHSHSQRPIVLENGREYVKYKYNDKNTASIIDTVKAHCIFSKQKRLSFMTHQNSTQFPVIIHVSNYFTGTYTSGPIYAGNLFVEYIFAISMKLPIPEKPAISIIAPEGLEITYEPVNTNCSDLQRIKVPFRIRFKSLENKLNVTLRVSTESYGVIDKNFEVLNKAAASSRTTRIIHDVVWVSDNRYEIKGNRSLMLKLRYDQNGIAILSQNKRIRTHCLTFNSYSHNVFCKEADDSPITSDDAFISTVLISDAVVWFPSVDRDKCTAMISKLKDYSRESVKIVVEKIAIITKTDSLSRDLEVQSKQLNQFNDFQVYFANRIQNLISARFDELENSDFMLSLPCPFSEITMIQKEILQSLSQLKPLKDGEHDDEFSHIMTEITGLRERIGDKFPVICYKDNKTELITKEQKETMMARDRSEVQFSLKYDPTEIKSSDFTERMIFTIDINEPVKIFDRINEVIDTCNMFLITVNRYISEPSTGWQDKANRVFKQLFNFFKWSSDDITLKMSSFATPLSEFNSIFRIIVRRLIDSSIALPAEVSEIAKNTNIFSVPTQEKLDIRNFELDWTPPKPVNLLINIVKSNPKEPQKVTQKPTGTKKPAKTGDNQIILTPGKFDKDLQLTDIIQLLLSSLDKEFKVGDEQKESNPIVFDKNEIKHAPEELLVTHLVPAISYVAYKFIDRLEKMSPEKFLSTDVILMMDIGFTIPMKSKLSLFILYSAMAMALSSFKIPVSLMIYADVNVQFIIKKPDESITLEELQMILDSFLVVRKISDFMTAFDFAMLNIPKDHTNISVFSFSDGLSISMNAKKWMDKLKKGIKVTPIILSLLSQEDVSKIDAVYKNIASKASNFTPFIFTSDNKLISLTDTEIDSILRGLVVSTISTGFVDRKLTATSSITLNETEISLVHCPEFDSDEMFYAQKRLNTNCLMVIPSFALSDTLCAIEDAKVEIEGIEEINLDNSPFTTLFDPNKATKWTPSENGYIISLVGIVRYIITNGNDKHIYMVKNAGLISSYSCFIVIDCSQTFISEVNVQHILQSLIVMLKLIDKTDIHTVTIIAATGNGPIVIAKHTKVTDIISSQSKYIAALYNLMSEPSNYASIGDALYLVHNMRSKQSELESAVFVFTDCAFSQNESEYVSTILYGLQVLKTDVIGIGTGLYPHLSSSVFTQTIYARNPLQIHFALANLLNGRQCSDPIAKPHFDLPQLEPLLESLRDQPVFDKFYELLKDRLTSLIYSSFWINPENDTSSNLSSGNDNSSKKSSGNDNDLGRGDCWPLKILFCQFWDASLSPNENPNVTYDVLVDQQNGVVQSLKTLGSTVDIVQNYREAIACLQSGKYSQVWIICSRGNEAKPTTRSAKAPKAAVKNIGSAFPQIIKDFHLAYIFVECVEAFRKQGGGVAWWADMGFTFELDYYLKIASFNNEPAHFNFSTCFDKSKGKMLKCQKRFPGPRKQCYDGNYVKKGQKMSRPLYSYNVSKLYEGDSIACTSGDIKPFKAFSYSTNGFISNVYYEAPLGSQEGDVIIDGAASRLFFELNEQGVNRLVRNMAVWLVSFERRSRDVRTGGKDIIKKTVPAFQLSEFRPIVPKAKPETRNIEIVFVIDATMPKERIDKGVIPIAQKLTEKFSNQWYSDFIKIGVVSFKDLAMAKLDGIKPVIKKNTADPPTNLTPLEQFDAEKAIRNLTFGGGCGDGPEDWVYAFTTVAGLSFTQGSKRLAILFTDQGTHGKGFHVDVKPEYAKKTKIIDEQENDKLLKAIENLVTKNIDILYVPFAYSASSIYDHFREVVRSYARNRISANSSPPIRRIKAQEDEEIVRYVMTTIEQDIEGIFMIDQKKGK